MPDLTADPLRWSVADLVGAFRAGTLSPVELLESSLSRIGDVDDEVHAYVQSTADLARQQAEAAAEAYRVGDAGPLAGVPVSVKDAFHLAGYPTTLGSLRHVDDVAEVDSGVVRRLRGAGAVFPGKTNVPEFCQSATTQNLLGPDTTNPWDTARTPGGSSGGAAASVASGTCTLAVGSDGGGSIRIPAAFTGLVGLKPTTDRCADEHGFRAFSPFCSPGPLAWRTDDARHLFSVLADESVVRGHPVRRRIAWCPRPERRPVDRDLADVLSTAVAGLSALGHRVEEVDLPTGGWMAGFGDQVVAEEYKRRGDLLAEPDQLTDYVRATLTAGRSVDDTALERARSAQVAHGVAVDAVFESHDMIVTPATAVPAFRLGERPTEVDGEPVDRLWGAFPFTTPFNVSGHPAMVVPVGLVEGMPVGLQLVAAAGHEADLLDTAEQLEEALDLQLWCRDLPAGDHRQIISPGGQAAMTSLQEDAF
jgi:Asp-tRNA(Asn)/Glu-tRNA(Gln) amidotransferase A subunit family amidase